MERQESVAYKCRYQQVLYLESHFWQLHLVAKSVSNKIFERFHLARLTEQH